VGCGLLLVVIVPALSRTWRWLAVAVAAMFVVAIAFTRIALGVHFLSDVVGGILLGTAWVAATTAAFDQVARPPGATGPTGSDAAPPPTS
jgi:undecaprenyl-diphosphatase